VRDERNDRTGLDATDPGQPHHGSEHRPSLGGGPMTTTKRKSKTTTPMTPATEKELDVAKFNTRSSSS